MKRFTVFRLIYVLMAIFMMFSLYNTSSIQAAPPTGGSYIIVFNENANARATVPAVAQAHGLQVGYVYEHAIQGMSAYVPAGQLNALRNDPRVAYVVEDFIRTVGQDTPTGISRIFADTNSNIDIDSTDDFRVDVDVAVIDTGIDLEHPDLNVINSTNCTYSSGSNYYCGAGGDDDHYHGTHVAGTIAALDNGIGVVGVAPGARLWGVKVCTSSGSCPSSAIIAGIDYVASNSDQIEVANMSLGGSGYSQAEYDAIQGAVDAGVAFAVAAGNDNNDANYYSPAAFDNALTVSALADFDGIPGGFGHPTCRTDGDDTLANFSNWGTAIDIAAPGVCIYSTFPLEQGGYGTISGTSMASPHVAGALALLASRNNPADAGDVYGLYDQITSSGNYNWTDDSGDGIKEPLLDVSTFNPVLVPTGGTGDEQPTVSITAPTDGATFASGTEISFAGTANDTEDGDLTASLVWTSDLAGEIGTGGSFTAVLSDGTHQITASVTDSGSNTGSDIITITVESGGTGEFILSVTGRSAGPNRFANLTWSGASTSFVDVYRDGTLITTTDNDGVYSEKLGKVTGTFTYQLCEEGSITLCSNTASIDF